MQNGWSGAMKQIHFLAFMVVVGWCPGCGPGEGTELQGQGASCVSSLSLAPSEDAPEAKTLGELIGACNPTILSSNTTEVETPER